MHVGLASLRWGIHVSQKNLPRCNRLVCKRGFTRARYLQDINCQDEKAVSSRTRNIGIIAHIDAGKTTTTERMLYYSGYTRRIGDVDDGSTVTDFLPAERARGITIQSAAITFHWPPLPPNQSAPGPQNVSSREWPLENASQSYTINLIDTPGHADFTFEVLRSLRILDGAVCILDGVAGVEAQTEKVWHQAQAYNIPKIIYVNKLDREGAAFGRTVREIASKLHAWPAVCQIPWFENGNGRFIGVVDVVNIRALRWVDGGDGKCIKVMDLQELFSIAPQLAQEATKARTALVELLSEYDDVMVEKYLECNEDHMAIMPADITQSLRKCLLSGTNPLVPVFAGASFRNIGVQPILDAITNLLPSPRESPDPEISTDKITGGLQDLMSGKLVIRESEPASKSNKGVQVLKKTAAAVVKNIEACALAFKVVSDPKRGVLVYVRVYHGSINRNAVLYNTNLQLSERAPRLLKMYASDAMEVNTIEAGHIGVITGLKHARTGDTLISYNGMNPKNGPPAPLNTLQLRPIEIPPPVFFASIEPQSLSEEQTVADALALLLREDPSLHISVDEDSGQTLLSGMGELHLEIARDRLIQDMKAKATMGKIEIGYRESISTPSGICSATLDRVVAGKRGQAGCRVSVTPLVERELEAQGDQHDNYIFRDGNLLTVALGTQEKQDELSLPPHLSPAIIRTSLENGAVAALARGPLHSFPMHSTHVSIHIAASDIFGSDTTPAALSSAARQATQAALKKSAQLVPTTLMEPVMNVVISVDDATLGSVVHDISSARGGRIVSLDDDDSDGLETINKASRDDIVSIDARKVYAPPDPFEIAVIEGQESISHNRQRTINARVPLGEMVGYLKHLRSITGGRGTFVMSVDRFEKMGVQRERIVLRGLAGL